MGLEHLHKEGVVYKDLKPENILIGEDGYAKLTDFGLSYFSSSASSSSNQAQCLKTSSGTKFFGTLEYLAPEFFKAQEFTEQSDLWAFGCLLYEMMVGLPPFMDPTFNQMKTMQRILNKEPNLKYFRDANLKDLFTRLLAKDPSKRF